MGQPPMTLCNLHFPSVQTEDPRGFDNIEISRCFARMSAIDIGVIITSTHLCLFQVGI